MKARITTFAITSACAIYLFIGLQRAIDFAKTNNWIGFGLALATCAVVLISAGLIFREIKFGVSMSQMSAILAAEQQLLEDSLPKTADGRIEKTAADERFALIAREVEMEPESWRAWFRLAIAYDDSRDRKRARAAMRTAEKLFKD